MTIGEKLINLRNAAGMSQDALAEALSVSRQSVSKWETDQVQPQIEKVMQICKLFSVSADDLLDDGKVIDRAPLANGCRNKYFGTDGFRGEANCNLTSMQAYKVGRFLGWYFKSPLSGCTDENYRPRIVIGKDTRHPAILIRL